MKNEEDLNRNPRNNILFRGLNLIHTVVKKRIRKKINNSLYKGYVILGGRIIKRKRRPTNPNIYILNYFCKPMVKIKAGQPSKVNLLVLEKHNTLRLIDKKVITEEAGQMKLNELNKKIQNFIKGLLDKNEVKPTILETEKANVNMEETKMPDVKEAPVAEKKQKVPKAPKVPKEPSNTALILDALTKKSTKNADDVVAKIVEKKPTVDPKKIKAQVVSIVKIIEKGEEKRFSEHYTWDKANYLLTKKE